MAATTACSTDPTDASSLPEDILDPGVIESPSGAMAAYRGTLFQFAVAFGGYHSPSFGGLGGSFIVATGLFSDELQAGKIGAPIGTATGDNGTGVVDSRHLPESQDPTTERHTPVVVTYGSLQRVRGQAREALGLLRAHAPDSTVLVGHLYATMGYAETFLAELYCSGIPLSTLEYDGTYTLAPGASTTAVLEHAVTMFDSAFALATDNDRIRHLASVGKGRALLNLGRMAEAAQAVATVPDGFRYLVTYSSEDWVNRNFGFIASGTTWAATVADREGGNGLDYVSSGDPRTATTPTGGTNQFGVTLHYPSKYAATGTTPIVLADWVEARLIEAEAALAAGDFATWLDKLNHLRRTAITPALADTTDPGTLEARVDLLFRERAFWLFLTGHRLGDLRRLVRQYGRTAETVFPVGAYPGESGGYGTDVTAPIPASERAYNPHFTGCLHRGA